MVFETPFPEAFGGPSGPGGYRIGRTAFPTFNSGKYTVIGNGATIEREISGRGEDALRFFDITTDADVTLQNLTLKNGLAIRNNYSYDNAYEGYLDDGGAIYNQGQLTVSSVIFDGNKADSGFVVDDVARGGAIYNRGRGSIRVFSSQFIKNSAEAGAAIASNGDGGFNIGGSKFEDNVSQSIIWNYGGHASITNSEFNNNKGDLVIQSDAVTSISDSTFIRNGIDIDTGTISIMVAVIGGWSRNDDDQQHQKMFVRRSLFAENNVRNGVVDLNRGRVDLEIISSTIANNASRGTAVLCSSPNSKVNITHSTIAKNINSLGDLNIATGVSINSDCELQISNTVITSEVGTTCGFSGNGVPALFSSSFSDDTRCRTGAVGNAMLGALADNGGPTQTMMPRLGSPLIDARPHNLTGSESLAEMMEDAYDYWGVMDQRFLPRYIDGATDIGAVERQPTDR